MALPSISADDVADAVFLAATSVAGFLVGGVVGLVLGLFAGYAYLELLSRVADLEATVNALIREKEDLRERVETLEADRE
ncbi:hypothetical protein GJ633_07625 [Halorubrum sp. CBA1125]|uniref:hypothetical protein n=1 Tax=Halorubrum sp. CBA1125 TaxID=2668072 RepID=UPI0012E74C5E|nr:hypothetical protein [Halorubrum sp. CBA1125]MUW14557.1 hypothetical protein [Halorubrum sp. CBA1125]